MLIGEEIKKAIEKDRRQPGEMAETSEKMITKE